MGLDSFSHRSVSAFDRQTDGQTDGRTELLRQRSVNNNIIILKRVLNEKHKNECHMLKIFAHYIVAVTVMISLSLHSFIRRQIFIQKSLDVFVEFRGLMILFHTNSTQWWNCSVEVVLTGLYAWLCREGTFTTRTNRSSVPCAPSHSASLAPWRFTEPHTSTSYEPETDLTLKIVIMLPGLYASYLKQPLRFWHWSYYILLKGPTILCVRLPHSDAHPSVVGSR